MLIIYINRELTGLSPLARGTQPSPVGTVCFFRFIPAGAGNSSKYKLKSMKGAVYPRWRGELNNPPQQMKMRHGLSPLARGTRVTCSDSHITLRFIPAGAGNSEDKTPSAPPPPVYPRWRGELMPSFQYQPMFHGLSPLARGTL